MGKMVSLVVVCLMMSGCGSGSPFDYVPVSGRVTYEDGTTIPGGFRLVFVAQDAAPVGTAHPRPAMASVGSDGKFSEVTSYKFGDGLIPGKHKVVIQSVSEQGERPLVPKEYTSEQTTPLEVDTSDAPFEIRIPKPTATR